MKALYITSLPLIVIYTILLIYYSAEYQSAYWQEWDSIYYSYDDYGYNNYSYYGPSSDSIGMEFGLISILFCLYFLAQDIVGLVRIKTATTKVLTIIGICVSGFMVLFSGLVASDPGAIGLNEVGPMFLIYSIIVLGFSIVGLIQSVKYGNKLKQGLA